MVLLSVALSLAPTPLLSDLYQQYTTQNAVAFVALGYISGVFLTGAVWATAMGIQREQWMGTLETVYAAPIPRTVIVAGNTLHSIQHQGLGAFLALLLASLTLRIPLDPRGIPAALLFLSIGLIASFGLGLFFSATVLFLRRGWIVVEPLAFVLVLCSPTAYPITVLPLPLQVVARINPLTYAIEGFRWSLIASMPLSYLTTYALPGLTLALIFLAAGLLAFYRIERRVRASGALSRF